MNLVPSRDPETPDACWLPRSDADLLLAQLRGIEAWHRLVASAPVAVPGQSREARLDEARRKDVADREREAFTAWAERSLAVGFRLGAGGRPRAVIAHRNDWVRDKVCDALLHSDVDVVARTGDGADACAAVALEQPDLVLVEDLLPTLSGVEVVRRVRQLAPTAVVGAHALGSPGMPALLAAGARSVFSRRIPPVEIVAQLVDCLHGADVPATVL